MQEESKELAGMDADEQVRRARDVTQSRILTQDEFKQVRKRQLQKLVQFDVKQRKGKKRKADEKDVVDVNDIASEQRCVFRYASSTSNHSKR